MSTRRARIKAVISLPPRRKNNEKNSNQSKPDQASQVSEKGNQNQDTQNITKSPAILKSTECFEKSKTPHNSTPLLHKSRSNTPNSLRQEAPHNSSPPLHKNLSKTPRSLRQELPHSSTPPLDKNLSKTPSSLRQELPHASNISKTPNKEISPIVVAKIPVIRSTSTSRAERPNKNSPVNVIDSPGVNIQKLSPSKIENGTVEGTDKTTDQVQKKNTCAVVNSTGEETDDSTIEETAMDGIIPLNQNRNTAQTICVLKNEIISENAEVLFDPIVPLPSPGKVRPKLRPVPRLGTLRRNSVQGSASESEDESRRALLSGVANTPLRQRHDSQSSHSTLQSATNRGINRIRNDSISSSFSQAKGELLPSSPSKEKSYKARRRDEARRLAAMRRRREIVGRNNLTMYDLIFYNPTANPIVPDQDEIKAKEANKKDEEAKKAEAEVVTVEDPDDPPEAEAEVEAEAAPVPQIKLGPNGEIILDEKSLVIKSSDSKRKLSSIVREGSWSGGGRYTRAARTLDWSPEETVRFYRALAALGTDFSLMVPLFPDRTRRDIKLKFKKEERTNGYLVDKAMRSGHCWDADSLLEAFKAERTAANERKLRAQEEYLKAKEEEERCKATCKAKGIRRSRGSKAVAAYAERNVPKNRNYDEDALPTSDALIRRAIKTKRRPKPIEKETPCTVAVPVWKSSDTLATITPTAHVVDPPVAGGPDITTLTKLPRPPETPSPATSVGSHMAALPQNIESGSLVVLTVDDPNAPSKKMLQTYIASESGQLAPVSLPPIFLNSVVGYMKKGTPRSSASGSPQLFSPVMPNQEMRTSGTPTVIHYTPSPQKRQRHTSNSYSIMQL